MNPTKLKILDYLKRKDTEVSTSEIANFICSKESSSLNNVLKDSFSNNKKIKDAKNKIAKHHRKILYYMSELLKENKILISRIGNKNQKYFVAIEKQNYSAQTLTKNKVLPIENYLEKRIINKHKPRFWFDCFDAIVLDASKFISLQELSKTILHSFNKVKDVIAINNFETILQTCKIEDIDKVLKRIVKDTFDFDRKVCFIFDVSNFHPSYNYKESLIHIIKILSENKEDSEKISVVFDLDVKELKRHNEFFSEIFNLSKHNGYHLYFKNDAIWDPFYVVAGSIPYTLDEKDWKLYKSKVFGNSKFFVLSQSTLYLDVKKFVKEYGKNNTKEFRKMFNKMLKSLLYSNNIQRNIYKNKENKNNLHSNVTISPFIVSKNYIRFNNFLWERTCEDKNIDFSLDMLKSLKQETENFCYNEETIYLSCGMPIRFSVALSNASREFLDDIEDTCFNSIKLSNIKDFHEKHIQDVISKKERLFEIFNGGDCITIKRIGESKGEDITRELNFIFNTYHLPLICYDFENNSRGETKLTEFIKWK